MLYVVDNVLAAEKPSMYSKGGGWEMYEYFFISNPRSMCELLLIGVSLFISNQRVCELMLI